VTMQYAYWAAHRGLGSAYAVTLTQLRKLLGL
jgi:hypothetical protein